MNSEALYNALYFILSFTLETFPHMGGKVNPEIMNAIETLMTALEKESRWNDQ